MSIRNRAVGLYLNNIKDKRNSSTVVNGLVGIAGSIDTTIQKGKQRYVARFPHLAKPDIQTVKVSLTSNCNYRCQGCTYGREFMRGEKLELGHVKRLLDDMAALHIPKVVFYGGEPLLHKSLDEMIVHAKVKGIFPAVGSNASLLDPDRADQLYDAGLRVISIGLYGVDQDYDEYVNRSDKFKTLESNIAYIRSTYPDVSLWFSFLLMKPTCNLETLRSVFSLSARYSIPFGVALVHYDFPYFSTGEDGKLQFLHDDLAAITEFASMLAELKGQRPDLVMTSLEGIKSIPYWLLEKDQVDVPCNMSDTLWVGPNGAVQVCQSLPEMGNIKKQSLMEIAYTNQLSCPPITRSNDPNVPRTEAP